MRYSFYLIIVLLILGCKPSESKDTSAQEIIDKSIEISGSDALASAELSFNFREKLYKASRNNGRFELERYFTDTIQDIVNIYRDVLSNDGFKRLINGNQVEVQDSMVPRYSASVNSVHYFSVLPFGLNDKAVKKAKLDNISINDRDFYTIKVTFNEEGGGEDFEDVFMYWINSETYKVEYLAYSYDESDGKGMRFREAFNERYVKNIRFVDYNNYKSEVKSTTLTDLPKQFEIGELKLLSKIELNQVEVELN